MAADSLSAISIEQLSSAVQSVMSTGNMVAQSASANPVTEFHPTSMTSLGPGDIHTAASLPVIMSGNNPILHTAIGALDASRIAPFGPIGIPVTPQLPSNHNQQSTVILAPQPHQQTVFIPQAGIHNLQFSGKFTPILPKMQAMCNLQSNQPFSTLHQGQVIFQPSPMVSDRNSWPSTIPVGSEEVVSSDNVATIQATSSGQQQKQIPSEPASLHQDHESHVASSNIQYTNSSEYTDVLEVFLNPDRSENTTVSDSINRQSQERSKSVDCNYCVECNKMCTNVCEFHGDSHIFIGDSPIVPMARASLPECLSFRPSAAYAGDIGLWTNKALAKHTLFSHLVGTLKSASTVDANENSQYLWRIFDKSGCTSIIDCSKEEESNWQRFMKNARNVEEQNIVAYQKGQNIHFITCKEIGENTELLYWYSEDYAKALGRTTVPEQLHQCTICGKRFPTSVSIKNHINSAHSEYVLKRWKCQFCKKSFRDAGKLETHSFIHLGWKPHKCTLCSKEFSDASNLKKHTLQHTGAKNFKCEICSQKFRQKAHLKSHILTHSCEKLFKCRHCDKTWKRSSDLKQHEKEHTEGRKFVCDICQRGFFRQQVLDKHKKIHTGEKDFPCPRCNKKFITKYHMERHKTVCKKLRAGDSAEEVTGTVEHDILETTSGISAAVQTRSKRRLKSKKKDFSYYM